METHSSILAWEIPRTVEPGGLWSMGSQKSWTQLSEWAHMHTQCITCTWILIVSWENLRQGFWQAWFECQLRSFPSIWTLMSFDSGKGGEMLHFYILTQSSGTQALEKSHSDCCCEGSVMWSLFLSLNNDKTSFPSSWTLWKLKHQRLADDCSPVLDQES